MSPVGSLLVREARRRAGLTQAELARRAGTTQSAIARLESGRTSVAFDSVVTLVRLCGFRLDVHLEPWDDSDITQAERLLAMSPDARVAENAAAVGFADELVRAYQASASG